MLSSGAVRSIISVSASEKCQSFVSARASTLAESVDRANQIKHGSLLKEPDDSSKKPRPMLFGVRSFFSKFFKKVPLGADHARIRANAQRLAAEALSAEREGLINAESASYYREFYKETFPHVMPELRVAPRALRHMGDYAKDIGLAPLKRNHLRGFAQPDARNVLNAVDVDLVTGKAVCYPRNLAKMSVCEVAIDPENFTKLKRLLESDALKQVPAETTRRGVDGCSYFIEVDMDGAYSWKCHWSVEDKTFLEVLQVMRVLVRNAFPLTQPYGF